MKILFLGPNPKYQFASQRFRIELYFPILKSKNISFDYQTFFDLETTEIIYQKGFLFRKIKGVLKGFYRRFFLLFSLKQYDYIFIHREATSIGPPFFEWIAVKLFKKKIIFDFDDSIWINFSYSNRLIGYLKWPYKVKTICKLAYKISAGNAFLADYAKQYASRITIMPTIVDVKNGHNRMKNQSDKPLVIGWTGTFSNFKFFELISPVIKRLEEKYTFEFRVIADKNPNLDIRSIKYLKWNKDSEIDDLLGIHIGLMPLDDDEATRGKCGFKAIQYMALGIPALVSPVAVNAIIVDHTVNGYHCKNEEDWFFYLEKLILNENLRTEMGEKARQKIVENYSVEALQNSFLSLFS